MAAGPISRILTSTAGLARTQVAPDAAVCADCAREVVDPGARRFRYPFTTCTRCGPRLSVVTGVPYDCRRTTLAEFPLCAACAGEYGDPGDRRFHAEAIACPRCGPTARLVPLAGRDQAVSTDALDALVELVRRGEIVAIKGLGGYHLACDATRSEVIARLRARKRRDAKPFALMARDLEVIRRYCFVGPEEEAALRGPDAPIVLLASAGPERLPGAVAPGLRTLGFMLPMTPLHVLLLRDMDCPW